MENRIDGHTKLFALIESAVGHSGSPAMYNYSFERLGMNCAYLAFDTPLEETSKALEALRTLHVGGFNVTMPCKTMAASLVDHLSDAAQLIGACNTVVVESDGTLTGHNTDGIGFIRNLKEHGISVKDKKITVLGAGGAATAICVQAALDGASQINIFNRKDEFYKNGEETVQKIQTALPHVHISLTPLEESQNLKNAIKNSDILVNATKVGMSPLDDGSLADSSCFHQDLVVADTVLQSKRNKDPSPCQRSWLQSFHRRHRHALVARCRCISIIHRKRDARRRSP